MTATRGAKSRRSSSSSETAASHPNGKTVTVRKAERSPTIQKKKTTSEWNTMSHLFLKRFSDSDATLTAGAKRDRKKHPHVAIAELDPSGRAHCKLCGQPISKSSLRFGLMLECHKGYRNVCTLHPDCFWKHREIAKLTSAKEINLSPKLTKEQADSIVAKFDQTKKQTVMNDSADPAVVVNKEKGSSLAA